jgi:hypothetical protein
MAVDNSTIMAGIWLEGTNDFQQRVPDPTQHGLTACIDAIFDATNRNLYNQFVDALINRIGATYIRSKRWDNPLAAFKGERLRYGSVIQEVAPKWIRAHTYKDDVETLLRVHKPEMEAAYHQVNREDKYPITLNEPELRMAFTDEYGLNSLVASIMTVPQNSDNYDEYLIMKQLIAEYEHRWGFFKMNVSAMPTDDATGKEFLSSVRTMVGKLRFPSTLYNAGVLTDIPVFANTDELILITTPEVSAHLSVDVLSSIFHIEQAQLNVRTVIIDEFPIPNAVALLTTRDWFMCHDYIYTTTSFYNGETLSTNYYLHHWGVYSCSPFVPAILWTTDAGTQVQPITMQPTGITVTADKTVLKAGESTRIRVTLGGTVSPETEGIEVAPDSVVYEVSAMRDDEPVVLNSRTRVDRYGYLHLQKSGLEPDDVISVACKSTYINPSGATQNFINSVTITIVE